MLRHGEPRIFAASHRLLEPAATGGVKLLGFGRFEDASI